MDQPSSEQILASAVRFLIDGHEEWAAHMLLTCTLDVQSLGTRWESSVLEPFYQQVFAVRVRGPRIAHNVLQDSKHKITIAVQDALQAVLSSVAYEDDYSDREQYLPAHIGNWIVAADLISIDQNWRTELLEIARGEGISNQGTVMHPERVPKTWNNLRFRSMAEVRVAEALDQAGVMFLPNCMARVNSNLGRRNREPDFLVCCQGRWGILEVDGEPFHPPSRTTEDHERDRLFKTHGVRVVEHFDATQCYEHAGEVVQHFLTLLKSA